jgi:hypothetical protein
MKVDIDKAINEIEHEIEETKRDLECFPEATYYLSGLQRAILAILNAEIKEDNNSNLPKPPEPIKERVL